MKNRHEYNDHWDELSWMIRLGRADNRCERCGALNRTPNPKTGRIRCLTVSHLNHNKRDDRAVNLLSVCNACHFEHDRPENQRKAALTRAAKKAAKADAAALKSPSPSPEKAAPPAAAQIGA